MNKFYLPQLKKIQIVDYTLYECPFEIEFSSKLNIIFGTNGTGKSTLLMLIIFSIIGPYKGGIKTKTRLQKRKDNRPIFEEDFFKDRTIELRKDAKVISEFIIHEDKYIVEHSLDDTRLISVTINDKKLEGKKVTYKTYESKFTRTRELDDEGELKEYLIYKYQKEIQKSTCLPGGINTLISMFLDVMFFDEGRKYTFWSSDLQETVISKYIVDESFYEDYCEKKLDTKALESAYKKSSETLNFMKRFLEREKKEKENEPQSSEEELRLELVVLDQEISRRSEHLVEEQSHYKRKNNDLLIMMQNIEYIREKLKRLEEMWYKNLFPAQYNRYYKKFSGKMLEDVCPVCGKNHNFEITTENCIFCNEHLEMVKSPDLIEVDIERKNQQIILNKKNKELSLLKIELKKIKNEIKKNRVNIEKLSLRRDEIEAELKPSDSDIENNDIKRLAKAQKDRDEALNKYNVCKKEEEQMRKIIENSLVSNFREFSDNFVRYAKLFYGNNHTLRLSLPFAEEDNVTEELMIKFQMDGKTRDESYMLSESQRIFTDLAFRFSILTSFHTNSFFMCETPDSTLDFYHETNAVETFLKYINDGNMLILTANARKSDLLSKLCNTFNEREVRIIDLTKLSNLALSFPICFDEYLGGF